MKAAKKNKMQQNKPEVKELYKRIFKYEYLISAETLRNDADDK